MITIKTDRSAFIPQGEELLGYENDHGVMTREFMIKELLPEDCVFRIDVENTTDIIIPEKTILPDGRTILTWTITSAVTQTAGIITIQLRAFDPDGTLIWHAAPIDFRCGRSVHVVNEASEAPIITEFEQLEQRVELAAEHCEDCADEAAAVLRTLVEEVGDVSDTIRALGQHLLDTDNPHEVTASDVGAYTDGETDTLLDGKLNVNGGTAFDLYVSGSLSVVDIDAEKAVTVDSSDLSVSGVHTLSFDEDAEDSAIENVQRISGLHRIEFDPDVSGTISGLRSINLLRSDAATAGYVDDAVGGKLNRAGDTMTGALAVHDDDADTTATLESRSLSFDSPGRIQNLALPMDDDEAASKRYVDTALEEKANIDGSYADLNAGTADQLNSSVVTADTAPYLFRTSGGQVSIGNRVNERYAEGASVVRNQLVNKENFKETTTVEGVTYTNNEDGTWTATGTPTGNSFYDILLSKKRITQNHVYMAAGGYSGTIRVYVNGYLDGSYKGTAINCTGTAAIAKITNANSVQVGIAANSTDVSFTFKPQLFDLTQMFGVTIADHLATLPIADALALIKPWIDADNYYPYNEGSFEHVSLASKKAVGFNQYDSEAGYARVFGGNEYYVNGTFSTLKFASSVDGAQTTITLTNHKFTPAKDGYVFATGASADFCVNLSWSGKHDGEYKAYEEHVYPMPTGELRGIPKLVDGKIVYDGDRHFADGHTERRYGTRTYESGDESDSDVLTNGTTTVYKLAASTTEQGTPYTEIQIVNDWGTEEFIPVTGNTMPVGHYSEYPIDMASKLENQPNNANTNGIYAVEQDGSQQKLVALDSEMSGTSDNAVKNSVIKGYIDNTMPLPIVDFDKIKNVLLTMVRGGTAKRYLPVGSLISVHDSDENVDNLWRVAAYDHIKKAGDPTAPTMLLEMMNVWSSSNGSQKGVQFCARQAFYYAESELAAGTYHFTVKNQVSYTEDNNKVFQFTLLNAVPAGGQLVFQNIVSDQTLEGKSVASYSSATSTTAIETATISLGSEGADLGATDGTGNMNHMHRVIYGSNNWAQSPLRQILNSNAASYTFSAQTKFDRPPNYGSTWKGFMHGLPSEFVSMTATPELPCRTNSVYETDSLDGTTFSTNQVYTDNAKVFVLSRPEIYGTWDSTVLKDGEIYELYNNTDDAFKIKRDNGGTARYCWLRSPIPGYACFERGVSVSGALMGNSGVNNYYGVCGAVIIA